ncbi:ACP S-malonyltransferase [Verrucomicrobiales bacterium]|jgi:[acyl-carrier-protein] S-malonyltransferase|nr:ACP S-malonyltransferase [Verrucomicrobiales bacterium]MDB2497039.1 ACP S-malonyltransferase [Verrucomicrobiales bacterium]
MGKRAVLLFAGQGAQTVGMGRDLAEKFDSARELFDRADEQLGYSLAEKMFDGPSSELMRTSICQPALYVHGLACLELLKAQVPDLDIAGVAGLSLGEFTAHAAAGTFDFSTGLDLVAQRGSFMEEATSATQGSMAALIGGEEGDVRRLAADCDIDVANLNAPGQIVVSGTKEGIEKAVASAEEYGIRVAQELEVAGAYHSRLMMPAQEKLAEVLADLEMQTPSLPVTCNVEGREVSEADEIGRTLEAQVSSSVRWSDCVQHFIDQGEEIFIELGPGRVLAGLMRRIDRKKTALSFADAEGLEKVVEALAE